MDLVIMAAGMGSRFGGLKQLEPVGQNGEFIIDFNIYDAKRYGFDRVVLIVKEEQVDLFKDTIGKRLEGHIDVEYVYQTKELQHTTLVREKPWGTGQAILCCKDTVKGKFAVINADDYYGEDCFKVLAEYIKQMPENECGTVGYMAKNTINETGSVKRGVLTTENGKVTKIVESLIEKEDNQLYATKLGTEDKHEISEDTRVSMNALAFNPVIFDYLEEGLDKFVSSMTNPEKDEYLLPDIIQENMDNGKLELKMINTTAKWYGMTYREDIDSVKEALLNLSKEGIYPEKLWQ